MRARTFLEFPTRPIRKNRIRVTNCRNASGFCVRALRAPTTWPRFPLDCLVGAYRFGICAVSASFLISYILAANVGWVCGRSCSSYYTIIINNEAAAPVSRIAFVSSDVLLPSLAERKVKRLFSFFLFIFFFFFGFLCFTFFFAPHSAPYPFGDFCTINMNCFFGKLCVPRTQKL